MIIEICFVVALVTSAFFAMYLKETLAAVLSLSTMLVLLSLFYFSLNAPFAAIFQLALGTGTTAVFLLAGEPLDKRSDGTPLSRKVSGLAISILLSIPVIIGIGPTKTFTRSASLTLPTALWELRSVDVIAQGIVILTVALGVAFFLKEKRRQE